MFLFKWIVGRILSAEIRFPEAMRDRKFVREMETTRHRFHYDSFCWPGKISRTEPWYCYLETCYGSILYWPSLITCTFSPKWTIVLESNKIGFSLIRIQFFSLETNNSFALCYAIFTFYSYLHFKFPLICHFSGTINIFTRILFIVIG